MDLNETDPPRLPPCDSQVTLDMLTDQQLIDELINRERIIIVTSKREQPLEHHSKPGLLKAVYNRLARDIGEHMQETQMIAFDETYNYHERMVNYQGTVLVISLTPEERPI